MDWITSFLLNHALTIVEANILPIVVTAIVGWAAVLYTKLTGRQLDTENRNALQSALQNGIRSAIDEFLQNGGQLNADGTVPLMYRPDIMEHAAGYVRQTTPDALRHFKIANKDLPALLKPHMPLPGAFRIDTGQQPAPAGLSGYDNPVPRPVPGSTYGETAMTTLPAKRPSRSRPVAKK